ncbi:MAG: O-antigen ligase family protein [Armatimonadota bacterium]
MMTEPATLLPAAQESVWEKGFRGLRAAAVAWLLFVGVWSGPSWGATLAYPNGFVFVEIGLLLLLIVGIIGTDPIYGKAPKKGSVPIFPFRWPCLAVLALIVIAAVLRTVLLDIPFDSLRIWRSGEPILRGLLLYLAIAGQPEMGKVAWRSLLAGLGLLAAATIIQHFTGVTRWYPDFNTGWASGIEPVYGPRAQGLTSYINLTAAILAAALPVVVFPLLFNRDETDGTDGTDRISAVSRPVLIVGALVLFMALWYTNSRGPILALGVVTCLVLALISPRLGLLALLAAVSFLVGAWLPGAAWAIGVLAMAAALWWAARRRRLRLLLPVVIGLALAGGLGLADALILPAPMDFRVLGEGMGDHVRAYLYRQALGEIDNAPWQGIGDAALADRLILHGHPDLRPLPTTQQNAHNQFLQWAVAEGLPVALGYSLLLLWTVAWLWRAASSGEHLLAWSLLAAVLIFLATNLVEAHFWRIEGGGFYWMLLGVGAALMTPTGSNRFVSRSR